MLWKIYYMGGVISDRFLVTWQHGQTEIRIFCEEINSGEWLGSLVQDAVLKNVFFFGGGEGRRLPLLMVALVVMVVMMVDFPEEREILLEFTAAAFLCKWLQNGKESDDQSYHQYPSLVPHTCKCGGAMLVFVNICSFLATSKLRSQASPNLGHQWSSEANY